MWQIILTTTPVFAQQNDSTGQPAFPGANSNAGIQSTLVTALVGTSIGLLIFSILSRLPSMAKSYKFRERLKVEYGKAPRLRGGLLKEFWFVFWMPITQVRQHVNTDVFLYLQFLRFSALLLGILSFFGLVILIPINTTGGGDAQNDYGRMSIQNVVAGSNRLWAHIIFSYIFVGIILLSAFMFMRYYIMERIQYLRATNNSLHARSVLVNEIQSSKRSVAALKAYVIKLLKADPDVVEQVCFIKKNSELKQALKNRTQFLRKLEHQHVKMDKLMVKQQSERELVMMPLEANTVQSLENSFKEWDEKVQKLRSEYLNKSETEHEISPTAIVTLKDSYHASVLTALRWSPRTGNYITRAAPLPLDLLRGNAQMDEKEHQIRVWLFWTAVVTITVFFSVPIGAATSLLTSLNKFQFIHADRWPDWLLGLVQGTLPVLVVVILVALIPPIFSLLAFLSGVDSQSKVSRRLFTSYYLFQLVNILLVVSIAGTAVNTIAVITSNPTSVISLLANNLPRTSSFFVNYVIFAGVGGFGMALSQIGPIFVNTFMRIFFTKTPREHMQNDWGSAGVFNEGFFWPNAVVVWNLVIVYMIIAPVILPFACIYFMCQYQIMKHQLVWIQNTRYDSGGLLIPSVFGAFMTGLYIFCITMGGLFALLEAYAGTTLLILLLFPLSFFHVWCQKRFIINNKQPVLDVLSLSSDNLLDLPSQESRVVRQQPSNHDIGQMNMGEMIDKDYAYDKCDYREGTMMYNGFVLDGNWNTYQDPYVIGQLPQPWIQSQHIKLGASEPNIAEDKV